MNYTERYNGFQITSPSYIDAHHEEDIYAIVKWEQLDKPTLAFDLKSNKRVEIKEHCFVIGWLEWNEKEDWFEFSSCGTRYLEYRENGLEEWLLDFCNKMYEKKYKHE